MNRQITVGFQTEGAPAIQTLVASIEVTGTGGQLTEFGGIKEGLRLNAKLADLWKILVVDLSRHNRASGTGERRKGVRLDLPGVFDEMQ